ncbi:uncharacterized protein LOC113475538 [Ciona intestinalis]
MKHIWILFLVQVLCVPDSNQLMTSKGSFELSLVSTKSKSNINVGYMMCLPKAPDYVYATARPSNPSLTHEFNLTILEIKRGYFVVELERVDQVSGWDAMIAVDWFMYIGKATVYQNVIIWFPDASVGMDLNFTEATDYCTDSGGRLVDIADKAMYDVIYNYCQQNIIFGNRLYVYTWLGSSYNSTAKTVTQSNGKPGYYGDWRPTAYPIKDPIRSRLLIRIVPLESTKNYYGMFNISPARALFAVQLCSINPN